MTNLVSRRRLLAASAGGLLLSGCDRRAGAPSFFSLLTASVSKATEGATFNAQRALMFARPLAREFSEKDISPIFKANGTLDPATDAYRTMLANGFSDWRLTIDGLVSRPQSYSIADLRALPSRTQITRHDCVEGWSAIGKWKGVQLAPVLTAAGLAPNARFAVFHCADNMDNSTDGSGLYYESVDLIDAFHPQTLLAYDLNDKPLEVAHGAPLRLRVERQLGYKQAKYLMRIEIVEKLDKIGFGKGGYWPDRGYEWYAGI